MSFLRKSLKEFRVLECLASSDNLFQMVNRNSCIVMCTGSRVNLCWYKGRQIDERSH